MATTPYVNEGDQKTRCTLHGIVFATGVESCPGCIDDPGAPLDDLAEPAEPAPDGCLSTTDVERAFVAIAGELAASIASIRAGKAKRTGKGTRKKPAPAVLDIRAWNAIAKLQAERVKALRSAGEYARARETEATVARRRRENRLAEQAERGGAAN